MNTKKFKFKFTIQLLRKMCEEIINNHMKRKTTERYIIQYVFLLD